jgi:hypothetical protein
LPVDITLNLESGKDIAAELAAAVEGKDVASITINLAEGGEYTVSSSLVAPATFSLNGNGATITAPAELAAAMITTPAGDLAEWNSVDFSINNVTIKGLAQAVFASAGKNYLYNAFTIDNVVAECTASIVFDFRKGGVAKDFTIQNSTFYAPVATNNSFYSSQSAQKATEAPGVTLQTFTLKNSTFYNYAYTKNFFTHRQSNQTWLAFTLVDNIFVNCGKSGQVVKGINQGQNGKNPVWTISGNIFNFDGADTSAAETTGDEDEPVQNSIAAVVTFADAAAGNFNATLALAEGAVAPESVGDPRWTVTVAGGNEIADGIYELTADMFKVWDGCTATSQSTEETPNFGSGVGTELKAGNLVYGNPSVVYLQYADATGYDSLAIVGTPGLQVRVLMNRLEVGNGGGDANGGALSEVVVTIPENGVGFVSFAGFEFVHINSIKLGWGSPDGTIQKIELVKGEYPEISGIDNIAAVAAQKDGKFFVNGKLVIVRNGQQFNANGQLVK